MSRSQKSGSQIAKNMSTATWRAMLTVLVMAATLTIKVVMTMMKRRMRMSNMPDEAESLRT